MLSANVSFRNQEYKRFPISLPMTHTAELSSIPRPAAAIRAEQQSHGLAEKNWT